MAVATANQAVALGAEPNGHRKNYARISEVLAMPNLIRVQTDSFNWFLEEGLKELFAEVSPITDFTGKNLELQFLDHSFG